MTRNRIMVAVATALGIAAGCHATVAQAANEPLRIEIREGVIRPVQLAMPAFVAVSPEAEGVARDIKDVVAADLTGTGLFREIPAGAHISEVTSFNGPISFPDWKAINAEALIVGEVGVDGTGRMTVKFRLFDVFAETPMGNGTQFTSGPADWRRIAHKIADGIYSELTGEKPFFDTSVAFISETGPKNDRSKRLAIMDYDGANLEYLTEGDEIVLAPRFSPDGNRLIYTSYITGTPRVQMLDLRTGEQHAIIESSDMTFAPRFSPDGTRVLMSISLDGNTDIYEVDVSTRRARRLTRSAAIETAPSYSPDGKWIVFESDRSLDPQIYVMRSGGSEPRRISFGQGRYGTPVWSPSGDYIAFTKQHAGRFHVGVMRADGSGERILSSSFLDEGPTWAPNGRVLMFFRETPGADGGPVLISVDVYGRNLRRVPTPGFASDPAWSPLRQ